MSISINPSKRSFDDSTNPPKRIKSSRRPEKLVFQNEHPIATILSYTSIADIGAFACMSKRGYELAQMAFLQKAHNIGYSVQNSSQAVLKLQSIFQYVRTLKEWGKLSSNVSTEAGVLHFARMNFSAVIHFLANPHSFQNPAHPVLELMEKENFLKRAKKAQLELTVKEKLNAYKALSLAAYYQRPLLVKSLLEIGADPNTTQWLKQQNRPDRMLPRPLQSAILTGKMESVTHLLAHNARLNINDLRGFQNNNGVAIELPGMSVLQYALGSTHVRTYFPKAELNVPMLKHLLDKGAIITGEDMIDAAETCSVETLQLLIEKGGVFDEALATHALFHLVEVQSKLKTFVMDTSFKDMCTLLLNHGANINGIDWNMPLHRASLHGSLAIVEFLVNHGADMTVPNADGLSPLMLATYGGSLEVVKFLLEKGVDVNQRIIDEDSTFQHSALTHTCYIEADNLMDYTPASNNPSLVKLLLSYGAEPVLEGENQDHFSPLHMARRKGLTDIVKILEDHIASSLLNE